MNPQIINPHYLSLLKEEVEKKADCHPKTSRDFEILSERIAEERCGSVSASTLKRLWGYVKDTPTKHTSTLDILARFVGYTDVDNFFSTLDLKNESESGYGNARVLDIAALKEGDEIVIRWIPERILTLRYEGGGIFEVKESINSKLVKGMRVRGARFIEGRPLTLEIISGETDQKTLGKRTPIYEAGRIHGITWEIT